MRSVIDKEAMKDHAISKYNFKVSAMGSHDEHEESPPEEMKRPMDETAADEHLEHHSAASSSRDELVESLLTKTEDVTSNFIKMQMKFEAREEAFKAELESARQEAYAEGLAKGRVEAEEEVVRTKSEGMGQFTASVKTLEESAKGFDNALVSIKEELLQAALDIAKEVIHVEITEHSEKIAKRLASQLITELQGASMVTLRVNPADHGYLSEELGKMGHVEVVSDSAVSKGGVIAISDVGNIDSEVMRRYERVKRAALSD